MKVLKFGGSSVAEPSRIKAIAKLIAARIEGGERMCIAVSAYGGATDQLIHMARLAERGDTSYVDLYNEIATRHRKAIEELLPEDLRSSTAVEQEETLSELADILKGVFLVKEASARTMDLVLSFGERLSAFSIARHFSAIGVPTEFCDARKIIRTDRNFGQAKVDFEQTRDQIQTYFSDHEKLQIVTGFIASCKEGLTTTLGRGGSDYTASILASCLDAEALEIWTDVSGVLTANPKVVKSAYTIPELSYDEAMELSHFGAKVIYPPTIQPALDKSIPIYIKNTFEPTHDGSRIAEQAGERPGIGMTGLTSISGIAMLTIEGSGLVGIPGTAARFFNCLGAAEVNVIMITQASSEHSICVAIREDQDGIAKDALEHEFRREIQEGLVRPIRLEGGNSIIAMVGEGMRHHPGVSGKLFSALGRNGINVNAVAQGSSELNVTFVVSGNDESKTLNLLHDAFFESQKEKLHVFLMGVGLIGGTLLEQIKEQQETLKEEKNLDIRIAGITNSRKMLFNRESIDLQNWKNQLEELGRPSSFEGFTDKMCDLNLANSVFVDCTAHPGVKEFYPKILSKSIAISTANKVAASSAQSEYDQLRKLTRDHNVPFLNETNVGAGLPVIATLQGLVESGDKVDRIEAVISGSLSYIFNNFNGDRSFQELVTEARELGYTEPDPREDLSGNDIKRKIIILARVAGFRIEPEEVDVEPLLPQACMDAPDVDSFFVELEKEAEHFRTLISDAKADDARLRYIASYENGKAKVSLQKVRDDSPFYNLASTDNMIVIYSDRYKTRPLTVAGPGAGAGVTAAGVFAELIQLEIEIMPDLNRIIRATAPPTIANLAVGFDLLGLAVQGEGDVVTARFETAYNEAAESNGQPSLRIDSITGDGGKLSKDIHINTISAGVIVMLDDLKESAPGFSQNLVLSLDKRMPLGSGMGSSASSAAAAVMAVNELLGRPFDKEGLVKYALIGESVASGAIHGDNVVPSLLGGLILMRENEPADIIRLPFFEDLFVLLVHPHVEVMTAASRGRLSENVSLAQHVQQNADMAAFVHALHAGDKELLGRCLNDHIIGPQRKRDIPAFDNARELVMEYGGLNYDISGSGPSTFAFFESADRAMEAGEKLSEMLLSKKIETDIHVTRIDQTGARVIEEEV